MGAISTARAGRAPGHEERWHERNPATVPTGHGADWTRCYTRDVKSVAATLRVRDAANVRDLTPDDRLALAFRLGDEDLESFRVAHDLDRRTAIRLLERRRQATRQPSACLERLIG